MPDDTDHQHPGEPPPTPPGGPEPPTGRHRLGPHVVGQRVVVRRVVRGETGPSGGPAMTDVLGMCTAWGHGRCVVMREDGSSVEIALADVVSGKPVPPRPSVRHREPAADLQRRTAGLWPQMESEPLGSWLLRAAPADEGRRRRRPNSLLAMGAPGIAVQEASDRAREWYAARDLPPIAQVETGADHVAALRDLGWHPLGHGAAQCRLASVGRAVRACASVAGSGSDGSHPTHWREDHQEGGLMTLTLEVDGTTLARGRALVDGDWVGLDRIHVDPAHRRRGLGTRLVGELLDHAGSLGATTAWLHVEADNHAAITLYERLDFRVHHSYEFLTIRAGSSA